jgi:Cft2 family RNA processing exonuclease
MKRFPKEQFDREAAKKYFSRVFEIYDSIIDIGYKQKRTLRIKDRNVRLVAFQCGNSIGAAFWRIGIGSYTIGYLSEYNHMDELHLGGFQPTQFQFKHFSLLITSSYNSLTKKMLVKDFTSKISRILTDNETTGTSVIFTTKSFARIFEYILQIEFVLMERKNAENYKFFIPETLE